MHVDDRQRQRHAQVAIRIGDRQLRRLVEQLDDLEVVSRSAPVVRRCSCRRATSACT
jgi:hypothetical protein